MFWLSHHREHDYNRTYAAGRWRVCARCVGTYPVLVAAIVVQAHQRAAIGWPADPVIALALPVPALIDWAIGRFRPLAGSNLLRTSTGVLLGLSLGRTLYIHFRSPFHGWLVAQLALCVSAAILVPVLTRLRR